MKLVHVARLSIKNPATLTNPVKAYLVRSIAGADNQTFTSPHFQ